MLTNVIKRNSLEKWMSRKKAVLLEVIKMSDKVLEKLRNKKLLELRRAMRKQDETQVSQQFEEKKQILLWKILSPRARQRLANLRLVKPEFTAELELELIQLAQQGKIPIPLSDEQLKQILTLLQRGKREIKIRRR